jgi:biotin operon repressor
MSVIDFPTAEEKQRAILLALQNGQQLTTQQCYRHFGTTELRKVVCRLREKGFDIRGERRDGNNYKTYYLAAN